jgi:hypothetical protein
MRYLLLTLAALASPAAAADYTLMIYESPAQLTLRHDTGPNGAAYWQGFAAAGGALAKAGALKGGAALDPKAAAALPKASNVPTPTGYFIITAADLAAAKKLAALIPAAKTGRVEIIAHAPTKTGM